MKLKQIALLILVILLGTFLSYGQEKKTKTFGNDDFQPKEETKPTPKPSTPTVPAAREYSVKPSYKLLNEVNVSKGHRFTALGRFTTTTNSVQIETSQPAPDYILTLLIFDSGAIIPLNKDMFAQFLKLLGKHMNTPLNETALDEIVDTTQKGKLTVFSKEGCVYLIAKDADYTKGELLVERDSSKLLREFFIKTNPYK